jgi:hypothetical protein
VLTLLRVSGWPRCEAALRMLERSRETGLAELLQQREAASPDHGGLRFVADTLGRWLRRHPGDPLDLGPAGAEAIVAMTCSWSVGLTHALAHEPRNMAELCEEVTAFYSEDATHDHIEALVRTGQAELLYGDGSGETRYALTAWGKEALAPLIAAARHECRFPQAEILPPEALDAQAAFQVSLPLLKLPPELRGTCRLGVLLSSEEPAPVGATVEVDGGRVVSSSILLERDPETWVTGTPQQWCEAVIDPIAAAKLDVGGDTTLAGALLKALHERLFGGGASATDPGWARRSA